MPHRLDIDDMHFNVTKTINTLLNILIINKLYNHWLGLVGLI